MAHSLLCAAGRDIRGVGGWLRSRPLIFAGEASFALYLMHELVIINLRGALQGRPRADAGALVAVAGVAAVVLHLAVERPANRWLRGGGRSIALEPSGDLVPSGQEPPHRTEGTTSGADSPVPDPR
jgi:peptidoglycan/LPS O-acetylase OafA/YrhL